VYGWPGGASAQSGEGFEPEVELVSPEGSGSPGKGAGNGSGLSRSDVTGGSVGADGTGPDGIGAGEAGGGLFGGGRAGADEAKSGGFWSWVADRGLGLVKGIGAGLIGAAVVGLGAVLIGVSAPVLAAVAGAAVLGGAVYGLFVGGRDFNWLEGIVGSVIGGVSAGVGGWLTAAGSAIAAKVGVAATNVVAGGLTSLSSYLIHSPDRSWGGALGALVLCCSKERRMTLSRKITQADRDKFELFLFEMDDVLEPFLSNAQQAGYRPRLHAGQPARAGGVLARGVRRGRRLGDHGPAGRQVLWGSLSQELWRAMAAVR